MSDIIFEFTDENSWEFLSEESDIIFEIEHLTESINGNSIGTINGDTGSVEVGSIGDTISIIGTTNEIAFTGSDKTLTASLPNAGHWDSAYGWGDHALVGYLTSYTDTHLSESDISTMGFTKDVEIDWAESQTPAVIHANNYTNTGDTTAHASFSQLGYAEAGHTGFEPAKGDDDNYVTDAMFASLGNISEWDSAYGWGDHASAGYVDTANSPEANDIARFTDGNTIEGRSYSEFKEDLDLEAGTDFYSKSAEDTWRDSVSQTEMGYLHGVTADIQTQINDLERLIYHLAL